MKSRTIRAFSLVRLRGATASQTAVVVLFLVSLFLPVYLAIANARAESDTTPMEFVSLGLSESVVDVSEGDGYTDLIGEVFEEVSGFDSIYFIYKSPSGGQLIEGDANGDPQYVNTLLRFPQNAEPGIWKPTFTLKDNATNIRVYTPEDLQLLGFNVNVTIVSDTPDTEAPVLSTFSFDSSTVDTGSGLGYISGTAVITDNMTTLDENLCYIVFTSPSGNQKASGIITNTSGNNFLLSTPFQQYTEVGEWTLDITLTDSITNSRTYDSTELANLGLPSSVTVTGNADTTPVSINALDFTAAFPPIGDIYSNSSKVTILANLTDNLSGISSADLYFDSQTSTQVASSISTFNGDDFQYTVFIPPFAATGEWLPRMITYDQTGNMQELDYTDLLNLGFDLRLNLLANETAVIEENESLTTDSEGDGATITEPFEASITSPVAGEVSISQVALTEPVSANDYLVFDQQYDIDAPDASPENPLVLGFRIDASQLTGLNANDLVVFRNGVLVENCLVSGVTDPDPCVSERNTLGDGDVELVVLTSAASIWVLGYPTETGPAYSFIKFHNPVKGAPVLNKANGGSTIPVKFDLGGDQGLSVLPSTIAESQEISCNDLSPLGEATVIATNGNGLNYADDQYRFNWKTLKQWRNTCRQLILEFSNGETIKANFKF